MKHRFLGDAGPTHFLVADPGEEVMSALTSFADERGIGAARVWGIGGLRRARLGFYDPDSKDYVEHLVEEQAELLGLHGNLTRYEGRPRVHLHAVLGLESLGARGGHLLEGHVHPTLELFVVEAKGDLVREMDDEVGFPVVRP